MRYGWDQKKNQELILKGRPSFEEVIEVMNRLGVLADEMNPVHPGQRIYVVVIDDYPYVVPYEMRGDLCWLITVYPARKFKREFYAKKIRP